SLGSGFVIDSDGVILTNHHVIRNAAEIEVFFNDAAKSKIRAKIVGSDPKTDLAVLKVKPGPYLSPLELGNSDAARVGETVVAIGNPFGLSHTVTAGIISAKNRVIGQGPYDNFIQTDASINFGNSGGPLFNSSGEVIGINSAISAQGQGLGFAIPVNQAKRLLPDLLQYGRVRRGWIGAWLATTPEGLYVNDVVVNSPAHKAGIRSGDFIVGIEDEEVDAIDSAERVLGSKKPGEGVQVRIRRESKLLRRMQKLRLTLIEEPEGARLPRGTI
ncbi:MAG: trypsin-like peptidase domain-containing protein, partial [Bdellovibrionales bacterium]|nr:trypsin-like peptidase domain-containing protein [Bdellovibrionales bacterium]